MGREMNLLSLLGTLYNTKLVLNLFLRGTNTTSMILLTLKIILHKLKYFHTVLQYAYFNNYIYLVTWFINFFEEIKKMHNSL